MGHHHRRDRGCGCERRGCFGGCGFGGGGGFPLALAAGYGGGYGPRFGADPVVVAPAALPYGAPYGGMMAAAPYGGMPPMAMQVASPAPMMAPPQVSFNQAIMGQYIAARNASGFPVMPIVGPLGFKSKKIRKHATRTVVARPESFYSPKTIFIPREVAKHFEICEIRVGQICVLGGRDAISAEMYSNQGLGPAVIQLPPMIPGQHVYLKVRNHSRRSHWFRGSLNGIVLA